MMMHRARQSILFKTTASVVVCLFLVNPTCQSVSYAYPVNNALGTGNIAHKPEEEEVLSHFIIRTIEEMKEENQSDEKIAAEINKWLASFPYQAQVTPVAKDRFGVALELKGGKKHFYVDYNGQTERAKIDTEHKDYDREVQDVAQDEPIATGIHHNLDIDPEAPAILEEIAAELDLIVPGIAQEILAMYTEPTNPNQDEIPEWGYRTRRSFLGFVETRRGRDDQTGDGRIRGFQDQAGKAGSHLSKEFARPEGHTKESRDRLRYAMEHVILGHLLKYDHTGITEIQQRLRQWRDTECPPDGDLFAQLRDEDFASELRVSVPQRLDTDTRDWDMATAAAPDYDHVSEFDVPATYSMRILSDEGIEGFKTMALPQGKIIVKIMGIVEKREMDLCTGNLLSKLEKTNTLVELHVDEVTPKNLEEIGKDTDKEVIVLIPSADDMRPKVINARAKVVKALESIAFDTRKTRRALEFESALVTDTEYSNFFFPMTSNENKTKGKAAAKFPSQTTRIEYDEACELLGAANMAKFALLLEGRGAQAGENYTHAEAFTLVTMVNGEPVIEKNKLFSLGREVPGAIEGEEVIDPNNVTAIVIGPHSDDEVLGPGAAASFLQEQKGSDVYNYIAVTGANAVMYGRQTETGEYVRDAESHQDLPREVKTNIREAESTEAAKEQGVYKRDESPLFLKLPFYESGGIPTQHDSDIVYKHISHRYKAHMKKGNPGEFIVFFPGREERHSTHRKIYELAMQALQRLDRERKPEERNKVKIRAVLYPVWSGNFNLCNYVPTRPAMKAFAGIMASPVLSQDITTRQMSNALMVRESAAMGGTGSVPAAIEEHPRAERFNIVSIEPRGLPIAKTFAEEYDSSIDKRTGYIDSVVNSVRELRMSYAGSLDQIKTYEQDLMLVANLFLPPARDDGWDQEQIREYLTRTTEDLDLHQRTFIFRAFYMATSRTYIEELDERFHGRKKPYKIVGVSPFRDEKESIEQEYALESKIEHLQWLFKNIKNLDWQLIFVDDGSKDHSLKLIKERLAGYPLGSGVPERVAVKSLRTHILHNVRQGFPIRAKGVLDAIRRTRDSRRGGASLYGFKEAAKTTVGADVIFDIDFDRAQEPAELGNGLRLLVDGGCKVAVGSKYMEGSFGIEAYGPENVTLERDFTRRLTPILGLDGMRTIFGSFNMYACDYEFVEIARNVTDATFGYPIDLLTQTRSAEPERKIGEFPVTVVMSERLSKTVSEEPFRMSANVVVNQILHRYREDNSLIPPWDSRCRQFVRAVAKGVYGLEEPVVLPPGRKRRAVIMAAGKHTFSDNGSQKPIVLRQVDGMPSVVHVLRKSAFFDKKPIVVVNDENRGQIKEALGEAGYNEGTDFEFVEQKETLGTGHALLCAEERLKETEPNLNMDIAVFCADVPHFNEDDAKLAASLLTKCDMAVPTAITTEPKGTILRNSLGDVSHHQQSHRILESRGEIGEAEAGVFFFRAQDAFKYLSEIHDAAYLPDGTYEEDKLTEQILDIGWFIQKLVMAREKGEDKKVIALPIMHPAETLDVETEDNVKDIETHIYLEATFKAAEALFSKDRIAEEATPPDQINRFIIMTRTAIPQGQRGVEAEQRLAIFYRERRATELIFVNGLREMKERLDEDKHNKKTTALAMTTEELEEFASASPEKKLRTLPVATDGQRPVPLVGITACVDALLEIDDANKDFLVPKLKDQLVAIAGGSGEIDTSVFDNPATFLEGLSQDPIGFARRIRLLIPATEPETINEFIRQEAEFLKKFA